jgi:hypothetical protein
MGRWEDERVRRWEDGKMGRWENGKMGRWEDGKMGGATLVPERVEGWLSNPNEVKNE